SDARPGISSFGFVCVAEGLPLGQGALRGVRLDARDEDQAVAQHRAGPQVLGALLLADGLQALRLQHRDDEVRLQAGPPEYLRPPAGRRPAHPASQPSEAPARNSPVRGAYAAAAAIIAALSVQSASGGTVSRPRPSSASAARWRSRVLAATPPQIT